jgi:hypothetical protein
MDGSILWELGIILRMLLGIEHHSFDQISWLEAVF